MIEYFQCYLMYVCLGLVGLAVTWWSVLSLGRFLVFVLLLIGRKFVKLGVVGMIVVGLGVCGSVLVGGDKTNLPPDGVSGPVHELTGEPDPGIEGDDSGTDLPGDAPGPLFALAPLHLAGDAANRPGAIVLPLPMPVEHPSPSLRNSPVFSADLWVSNFTHTVSQSVARVVYTNATLAFAGVPIPRRRIEAIVASTLEDGGDWSYYTNVTPWSVNMMSSYADFVFVTNSLPPSAVTNCYFGFGANVDSDSDGFSDLAEMYLYRTDPFSADTDGDGDTDGLEISVGSDPRDPSDGLLIRGRTAEWYALNYPGVLSVMTNSSDEVVVNLADISQTNLYYNLYLTPRPHFSTEPVTIENENGLAPDGASFVFSEGVTNVIPLRVGQSYLFNGIHLAELDFAADDPYVVVGTDGGSSFSVCRPVRILLTDVPPPADAPRCALGHVHARYCRFETDPDLDGEFAFYDTDGITVNNADRTVVLAKSGAATQHSANYCLRHYGSLGTFAETDGPVDLVFDDISPYSPGGNTDCLCGEGGGRYCPDCIGSTAAWYNLMFPDLLAATNAYDGSVSLSWRDGVASNAYYFIDITTTNKSVRVTVTPRVPTAQGAYQVQFLAGMTARIPLLAGVTYDLVGNASDLGFSTSDADVAVTQTSNRAYAVERPLSYELGGSTQTDTVCSSGHVHARHYRITTSIPGIPGTLEFDDTKCFTPIGLNEFVAECDGLRGASCPTNDVIIGRFIYEGVTNSFAITNSTLCRCDNLHHPTCPCGANTLCDECDTTIYGQDDAWVRANFTNAEEIIAIGYSDWVDEQVGSGLENGLYRFTALFEDDPPEVTQLGVGDYVVAVTNAGEYVFVLEKGVEYEFDTWPFNDGVGYWAQDDMAEVAPLLMSSLNGLGTPGEWTVDGGWGQLYCPYVYGGKHYSGRCSWWPTLQGSPDVTHLGETDFPKLFSAMVSDYPDPDSLIFYWHSSDENIHIDSPFSRQTMVYADAMPSWKDFDLSVSTVVNGHYLCSVVGSCSYGTNDCPQVRLELNIPNGVPFKGPRLPANYSFECDVATNGWLVLECTSSTNRVSLWQSATSDVVFACSNRIDSATGRSDSFYVHGESRSRSREDMTWKLSFCPASGETNTVSATSTVFGCYCQPVMDVRIPDGNSYFNPCSVKSGEDAWFRADVVPSMPSNNIVWRAVNGSVQFPGGTNGQMVRVRGSSAGDATLGVTVLDYTDERMKFELEVAE